MRDSEHVDQAAKDLDRIGHEIVDAAYQVHTRLGPGLLESIYEDCLAHELHLKGVSVQGQLTMSVIYREMKLEGGYRLDLLVAGSVIIEVKAVETVQPVHRSQILTYLKLSKLSLGYLINFNVPTIKSGIQRLRLGFLTKNPLVVLVSWWFILPYWLY